MTGYCKNCGETVCQCGQTQYDELEQLRACNAELERQLADETALREATACAARKFEGFMLKEKERAEQAEQRIAESQRQEPYAFTGAKVSMYLYPIIPPTVEEAVKAERERTMFILDNDAFLYRHRGDYGEYTYQLLTQDEDEKYHCLHNKDEFFKTPIEAVDAAIRERRKP